jgi:dihydrofolate synthase/folylpolyglutamate synthase
MNTNKFLDSLINYEKAPAYDYDLGAFRGFLDRIGRPQVRLKNVILIAGTKGKGSTCAILNSCLIAAGYRVGLFTSPHLRKVNERIRINDQPIRDEALAHYLRKIKPFIDYGERQGARSYFEALTAVAFLFFADRGVDFTILEVGLGGRRDATNVSEPVISVITRIGYDHTNLLGKKLSGITYEKAGIIRKRGLLVTVHQRPAVEKVIRVEARRQQSRLIFAEDIHALRSDKPTIRGTRFRVKGKLGGFNAFLPLAGVHQRENLSLSLAVLDELKTMGFRITPSCVRRGIRQTRLAGRFESLSRKPLVIYDAAHNEDSFRALEKNLELLRGKNLYLIFGCSADKDINYCVKNIFPKARHIFLVKADHPRAMDPAMIIKKAMGLKPKIMVSGTVEKAMEYLRSMKDRNLAAVICGSFYLYPQLDES